MTWVKMEIPALWLVMIGAFLLMGMWEGARPGQLLSLPAERRWGAHFVLLLTGGLIQAAIFRASPLLIAIAVAGNPYGLLNRSTLPFAVQFIAAILLLDLIRYFTHRLFHASGFLWRIHEVHHSDPDYDVSTAARFHPLEIVLGKALYLAAIAVLAPPVAAVFVAELHTALLNIFAHANVVLPPRIEQALRLVLITPALHRLHHSEDAADHNRNFGQTFVWWDRLFGTYLPASAKAGTLVRAGVRGVAPEIGIQALLLEPFRRR